ncbi:TolC family protein [Marivirga arenosa]|uniref:TolC family protein n=1 Tax=Marivirga arenosa TaxID=3059076 RepID=A0AA51N7S4_9BACT|nr:TolC family protein [Marivirga sp. ABR2-2]WMN06091.1 TolC family protein [Marivirga sp. ABR2-2]
MDTSIKNTYYKFFLSMISLLLLSHSSYAQESQMKVQEYFEIAVENNPGLQSDYKAYEAALQKLPQVSTLADPNFSIGYFISPVETRVGPQLAKFSLSQMFPWFGTLKANENVAALEAEAYFQNFLDSRNKLYWKVAQSYYDILENQELQKLEKENIEILHEYKALSERKLSSSKASMVDVLRVDIMIDDAETELSLLEDKYQPLLTAFQNILNSETEPEFNSIPDVKGFEPEMSVDTALQSHPLVQFIDYKRESSQERIESIRKQSLPKIGVGLDYVVVGERNDVTLSDNGQDVLMPMVSISLPIFRKKYKAQVKEAELIQEQYQLKKQNVINDLSTEYSSTVYEINKQAEYISLYQRQIEKVNNTLSILEKTYAASGVEFEELLRSRQQLLKYQKLETLAKAKQATLIEKYNYLTSKRQL